MKNSKINNTKIYFERTITESASIDLLPCGEFLRVIDGNNAGASTAKQEMVSASAIRLIVESYEPSGSKDGKRYLDVVTTFASSPRFLGMRGATVVESGAFLKVVDPANGEDTWLPAHSVEVIEEVYEPDPSAKGDNVRVVFAKGEPILFMNALIKPIGSFVYIRRAAEGKASWYPASAIKSIQFIS